MKHQSWFNFKLVTVEKVIYAIVALVLLVGLIIAIIDSEVYEQSYVVEDGLVEYGTAVMLFASSLLCLRRFWQNLRSRKALWLLTTIFLALLFFFGAGEEISWGQRIFGVESGDFFKENNAQGETNLHNLVVGEAKINKIVFGQLLTAFLIVYLFLVPWMFFKYDSIKSLVTKFGVPIPKVHHTVAFLFSTVIVQVIPSGKKWEVYEFAFALIFFLILLLPFNQEIYTNKEAE